MRRAQKSRPLAAYQGDGGTLPGSTTILPHTARTWEPRGTAAEAAAATPNADSTSAIASPVTQTDPLLTERDFAALLAVSKRTFYRLRAGDELPRPDLIVGRSPRWSRRTIEAWLRTRPVLKGGAV